MLFHLHTIELFLVYKRYTLAMDKFDQPTTIDNQLFSLEEQQNALRQHSAAVPADLSVIEMKGNDVSDFLQRISTNDFSQFTEGITIPTLFLTEKGRVIDLAYATHCGEKVLLFISAKAEEKVRKWLEKFIVMDDVSLNSAEHFQNIALLFADDSVLTAVVPRYKTSIFGLQCSIVSFNVSPEKLISDLRENNLTLISNSAWEEFRIINGIPRYGNELQEKFNPLELELCELISFTKGCYIGQEVIARLDTYKKVQRKLCLVSLTDKSADKNSLDAEDITEEAAVVTSIFTRTEGTDASIGLALVKNKYAELGKEFPLNEIGKMAKVLKIFLRS